MRSPPSPGKHAVCSPWQTPSAAAAASPAFRGRGACAARGCSPAGLATKVAPACWVRSARKTARWAVFSGERAVAPERCRAATVGPSCQSGGCTFTDDEFSSAIMATVVNTCWQGISEVNRTSTSLPLTAMHKEIAWLFRYRPTVIHDFRPLSHTDFYHIVHLDTKCLSLEPHRRVYLKRQALCYAGR